MSGGSDHSIGPQLGKKKRHPQLLKLVPARAQSCTDFGDRVPLLPSSMAAAAMSAARQRDSGSPPQFGTFSPFGSAQFRPRPSSAQSPCPSSNSAPPVLSPQRKGSRSARLCCSFRRTLRRGSPAKRLLVQSDSNQSAPAAGVINLREQAASAEKKDSAASITLSAQEESHLLAKAWQQQQRKESRLLLPDVPKANEQQQPSLEQSDTKRESAFSLRRLSKAFFQAQAQQRVDLMNDWEIGGTQNPWVCPSDRHLQLRAQLKSGWSVRTGAARSPTTSKQALLNGISEAEQEQIQKVLARAEAGRQNEQHRIGKMMERLDRLRTRATGNGITQCLLCQTEFGLLAAKSYAAMCSDCRKYVCQRNCGVETFDQKRREPVFLCKICSEYREVMWKKSGAWFYREMPLPPPSRPCSAMAGPSMIANGTPPFMSGGGNGQPGSPTTRSVGSHTGPMPRRQLEQIRQESRERDRERANRRVEPIPIPAEQQQRLKTNPRPRIIPSWVHDGLQQSSISVDDSDNDSASSSTSSSLEPAQFRKSLGAAKERALAVKQRAAAQQTPRMPSALAGGGPSKGGRQTTKGGKLQTGKVASSGHQKQITMQRVVMGRGGRGVTDSDSDVEPQEDMLSRRSSPSTSPRHSLATPSSYGGDDLLIGGNAQMGAAAHQTNNIGIGITSGMAMGGGGMHGEEKTMSDSRSVDSGVVQSDHSTQQQQQGLAAFAQSQQQIMDSMAALNNHQPLMCSKTPSPVPPPIPPRSATIAAPPKPLPPGLAQQIGAHSTKRPSSASAGAAQTVVWPMVNRAKAAQPFNNSHSSHESLPSNSSRTAARIQERLSGSASGEPFFAMSSSSLVPAEVQNSSRRSTQSTVPPMDVCKEEHLSEEGERQQQQLVAAERDSPTFMSSPEDDSNLRQSVRSLCDRRDALASAKSVPPPLRMPCQKTKSLCVGAATKHRLQTPTVSIESAPSDEESLSNLPIEEQPNALSPGPIQQQRRPHSANSLPTIDEKTSGTLGSIQFNLTYLAEEKQLIIHLIRAKNLKAMDKNGFSDPYVKFHLLPGNTKATKLTSKTIEKTLNPEWNEEQIYYGITEEERLRKTLRVTVLDRDRIGSDFLGETRVALRKLPPGVTKKFNLYLEHAMPVPLENSEDKERGKLLLSVCYNIQQGSLFVTIKRCAELLGMDSTGFSDPYCKVSLTPLASKAHRQKTTIKKRTLNPEFNETMQFLVPFKDLPKKTLEIGVYDYDVGRHDDYIGGIVLSTAAPGERGKQWQNVIENPGKTFEYWHKLAADD